MVSDEQLRDDIAELKVRVERCIESFGSAPAALQDNLAMREELLQARATLANRADVLDPAVEDERELLDMTMVRLMVAISYKRVSVELAEDAVSRLSAQSEKIAALETERDELLVSLGKQILARARDPVKLRDVLIELAKIEGTGTVCLKLTSVINAMEDCSVEPKTETLAELVGDARGEMADYREAMAEPKTETCKTCGGRNQVWVSDRTAGYDPGGYFAPCPDCSPPVAPRPADALKVLADRVACGPDRVSRRWLMEEFAALSPADAEGQCGKCDEPPYECPRYNDLLATPSDGPTP